MTEIRVTLKEVARKAGVSISTASMALQGSPKIAVTTKALVREAADFLHYRPDPSLSALIRYRNDKRRVEIRDSIGLLCPADWLSDYAFTGLKTWYRECYSAICERAETLGFRVVPIPIQLGTFEQPAVDRTLYNRGIRGVILAPTTIETHPFRLRWEKLSVVSTAQVTETEGPRFHTVTSDHYANMRHAIAQLIRRGHKRIAYVQTEDLEARAQHRWLAGFYLARTLASPSSELLDPLLLRDVPMDEPAQIQSMIETWIGRHRPDAVISAHHSAGWFFRILESAAGRLEPQVMVVSLSSQNEPRPGIREDWRSCGLRAVNLLNELLLIGEKGPAEVPIRVTVEGRWLDGTE